MTLTNDVEIRLFSMKRSGQHAIMGWILDHYPGRRIVMNNPLGREQTRLHFADGETTATPDPWTREVHPESKHWQRVDLYLVNCEDAHLERESRRLARVGPWSRGRSRDVIEIAVLRDPANLFASRIKLGLSARFEDDPRRRSRWWDARAVDAYLGYCAEWEGRALALTRDPVLISFNRWTRDAGYRAKIGERLGLGGESAKPYASVLPAAGGSSFDGTRFDGAAGKMRIHDRWRSMLDDERFRQLMLETPLLGEAQGAFAGEPEVLTVLDDCQRALRARESAP